MKWFSTLIYAGLVISIASCHQNRMNTDTSAIKEKTGVVRFEKAFLSLRPRPDSVQIEALCNKYPGFSELFFNRIVHIGTPSDSIGLELIHIFLNDSIILESEQKTAECFPVNVDFQKKLDQAFTNYRHYFPEKPVPSIYTCISGFNESVFVNETLIGISLDKYLGSDYRYYPLLGIAKYKQRRMIPVMIPADVISTWGRSKFPVSGDATTLLDHMVYEGKILWFCKALLPDLADTLVTGFSARQLKWCKQNEVQMWNFMIDNKLLFSTKQMDIVRYINDGPMTNGFPPESPAKTGAWIGWQIVSAYVKKHPEVTPGQLMADHNYQQILNSSGYAP
jgi:hypothetical protein